MTNKKDIKWRNFSNFTMNMPDLAPDQELFEAARYNDLERAKELIDAGANVNARSYDRLPLVGAAARGYLEIVKLLLENGADINAEEEKGCTAIKKAIVNGELNIVELLIEKGADIHIKNEYGLSALDMAYELAISVNDITKSESIHKKILAGLDFSPENLAAGNQLIHAITTNNISKIKELIESNVDINCRFGIGECTPLMMACFKGDIEIMKILLESGGDTNLTDFHGDTVLDVTKRKKQEEIIKYLNTAH